jgi:hypothetical protein
VIRYSGRSGAARRNQLRAAGGSCRFSNLPHVSSHLVDHRSKLNKNIDSSGGSLSQEADRICRDIKFEALTADLRGADTSQILDAATKVVALKTRLDERIYELYASLGEEYNFDRQIVVED